MHNTNGYAQKTDASRNGTLQQSQSRLRASGHDLQRVVPAALDYPTEREAGANRELEWAEGPSAA
ncbi:MAG: hypothetical protein U1E83_01335 [Methylotetracoccus sp.]